MIYTSYIQVVKDYNYMFSISQGSFERMHDRYGYFDYPDRINFKDITRLKAIAMERIKEKYEDAHKNSSALSRFLAKYPLKFKEFCCLIDIIENNIEEKDFSDMAFGISENNRDIFTKHNIRYESSQLRRFKLVYRIINPLKPMRKVYEASYKAQLELKGKKYTDAYQQLDMALEEESKRNSPDDMDSLYYIIDPKQGFDGLIASDELKDNLRAALAREDKRDRIFKHWGFNTVIEYGRGTTLNFRGPPGTGKTLAAHCLAKELGKKLLMVRYDQLQSCWVGETEKHIQRVFKMAKAKSAVLFFDEADAIALSRKELHMGYEMSQVNTLLKELERFEGVCIFATNFAEKYDEAFERRLTMHIDFKLPGKEQQLAILDKVLPKKSRDKSMDFKGLELEGLSGGDLKNVALNAAGIAAKDNSKKIERKHLEQAVKLVRSGKTMDTKGKNLNYIS